MAAGSTHVPLEFLVAVEAATKTVKHKWMANPFKWSPEKLVEYYQPYVMCTIQPFLRLPPSPCKAYLGLCADKTTYVMHMYAVQNRPENRVMETDDDRQFSMDLTFSYDRTVSRWVARSVTQEEEVGNSNGDIAYPNLHIEEFAPSGTGKKVELTTPPYFFSTLSKDWIQSYLWMCLHFTISGQNLTPNVWVPSPRIKVKDSRDNLDAFYMWHDTPQDIIDQLKGEILRETKTWVVGVRESREDREVSRAKYVYYSDDVGVVHIHPKPGIHPSKLSLGDVFPDMAYAIPSGITGSKTYIAKWYWRNYHYFHSDVTLPEYR
jgi:hypothetical protein